MQQHVRVDAAAAVAGGAVHDGGEEVVVAVDAAAPVAAVVVEVREGGHAIVDLVEVVLDVIVVDLKGVFSRSKNEDGKRSFKSGR